MSQEKTEAINRLREIQGAVDGLISEADRLIQEHGSEMVHLRATSYWIGHILGALDGRSSMVSMANSIAEMEEEIASERPQ